MPIEAVNEGEDVPIITRFYEGEIENSPQVDPDDTGTDGTPDATISITYDEDGTAVVADAAMTHRAVGEFEYVWDTAADTTGSGSYVVEATAEFGGETKIERDRIRVR